jgi:chromosome segregation ATPase
LEERISLSKKEITALEGNLSQFNLIFGKLEQIEGNIAQTKVDLGKLGDGLERSRKDSEQEQGKKRISEIDGIANSIQEIRKGLHPIPDLKKNQKVLETDYLIVKDQLQKLDDRLVSNQSTYDDYQRAQKMFDESRKTENKRLTDLQGEVSAYRKRIDEQRGKVDLALENLRNMEIRVTEITASESDRRQAQVTFIENQKQQQVERDRLWKDWQTRIEQAIQNSSSYETQFKNLEDMLRSIRKSKDQMDDSTQKIDRRVNEITEMHRLNEDHFRQEWTSFKADDQKRWANYNLVMDEQQKDSQRQQERIEKRVVQLEDTMQEMNDHLLSMQNETEKRLQNLLSLAHDWLSSYERLLGKDTDLD